MGFAASGKSTVFAALTGIDPAAGKGGLGTISVPDLRVDQLSALCKPRKTTYAEIVFQDFPTGAFGSDSLSPGILGEMRNFDVLAEVVDAFAGGGRGEVADRAAAFHDELMLSDLGVIEKRLDRLTREKGKPLEKETLERCKEAIERNEELREIGLDEQALSLVSGFKFLTLKPRVVVANVDEASIGAAAPASDERIAGSGCTLIAMSARLEHEISELPAEERGEFLADLGLDAPASERFVSTCYEMLELITFLTAGEDEVRAWPIRRGSTALEAAGKIHSDIARGFIRAEIAAVDDYLEHGGEAGCRKAGKWSSEGKDHIMKDGEVAHFRFNV